MAFTLEDGSGLSDSNAYIDEAFFTTFHADRAVDATFTSAEIQAHIIRASDYVDKRFGRRFRGERIKSQQSMEWPRVNAITDDGYHFSGVPEQLKRAIAEYTLISLNLDRNLAPMPAPDFPIQDPETGEVTNVSEGRITAKTEKVGPIEESTEYSDGSQRIMTGTGNMSQQIPAYPQADLWIEELIDGYNNRRLVRG